MDPREKRLYIRDMVAKLPMEDKLAVGGVLKSLGVQMSECADGCRVLLDVLDENTIDVIYGAVSARSKNVKLCL
jgi:hypothetical protein